MNEMMHSFMLTGSDKLVAASLKTWKRKFLNKTPKHLLNRFEGVPVFSYLLEQWPQVKFGYLQNTKKTQIPVGERWRIGESSVS